MTDNPPNFLPAKPGNANIARLMMVATSTLVITLPVGSPERG